MLFHQLDLTVFQATRHQLAIFPEGQQYDSQSLHRGHNNCSGQERRNFSPAWGCCDFSRESGIFHQIGGAGISHPKVIMILCLSDHTLIFYLVGPRDMVRTFRLTRCAPVDTLTTGTNCRPDVIGQISCRIVARVNLKGFLNRTGRRLSHEGDIPRGILLHSPRDG